MEFSAYIFRKLVARIVVAVATLMQSYAYFCKSRIRRARFLPINLLLTASVGALLAYKRKKVRHCRVVHYI